MTLILAFGNKCRQGKDTAAEAVVDFYDYSDIDIRAEQFHFAEALYEECRELHGMVGKDAPLLQRVGAERRAEDPNYWIDKVFGQIPEYMDVAVISDCRYKNEAEAVKAKGGYLINVQRLNRDGSPFVSDDRPADHPSEIDLDDYRGWDFFIKAYTGELPLVEQQAVTIAEYIRSQRG